MKEFKKVFAIVMICSLLVGSFYLMHFNINAEETYTIATVTTQQDPKPRPN